MCYVNSGERKDCLELVKCCQMVKLSSYQLSHEGKSYKYLRLLKADKFLEEKMKLNVLKEYIRRIRKVLKSKLNGGNLVHGINTWAVSLLRYSAAFVSWQAIGTKTRKLFTILEHYTLSQM